MNTVIFMEQHRGTRKPPFVFAGDYEDEILSAGWNPAVPHLIQDVARYSRSPELPESLSTVDVDAFLDRVYALATQV